jgi:hypothetical protein
VTSTFRAAALLAAVLVAIAGAIFVAGGRWLQESVPPPRSPSLPDLVSVPLTDLLVATDPQGNEALRFSSTIANTGEGPLLISARRAFGWNDQWNVVQWFVEENGGDRSGVVTGANLVFGGHGHDHWHLKFGASYRLETEGGERVASQTKAGFCFFDQVLYAPELADAPAEGVYINDSCGVPGDTTVEMGMSVGWSDPYFWQLEDQSVVISASPDGRYRLTATADPDNWIRETDEANNDTWVMFELGTQPDGLRTIEVIETAEAP